jgi:hypothetical protein
VSHVYVAVGVAAAVADLFVEHIERLLVVTEVKGGVCVCKKFAY